MNLYDPADIPSNAQPGPQDRNVVQSVSYQDNLPSVSQPNDQGDLESSALLLDWTGHNDYNSDLDLDLEIESDHNSEIDQEDDDSDDELLEENADHDNEQQGRGAGTYLFGKKKCFRWRKEHPPTNFGDINIILQLPGIRQAAKDLGRKSNPEMVWDLFFTQNILDEILQW